MMWPFKRKSKADPVGDAERTTDDLKQELRDLRERLLKETVKAPRNGVHDDR